MQIDLSALRRTIEAATPEQAAIVTTAWLEQAERELVAGRAASASLAALARGQDLLLVNDQLLKGTA